MGGAATKLCMAQQQQQPFGSDWFLDDIVELAELDKAPLNSGSSAVPAPLARGLPITTLVTAPAPTSSAVTQSAESPCWGHVLTHGGTTCTPSFSPQQGHFKNKFCPMCIEHGISVDPSRALLLPS